MALVNLFYRFLVSMETYVVPCFNENIVCNILLFCFLFPRKSLIEIFYISFSMETMFHFLFPYSCFSPYYLFLALHTVEWDVTITTDTTLHTHFDTRNKLWIGLILLLTRLQRYTVFGVLTFVVDFTCETNYLYDNYSFYLQLILSVSHLIIKLFAHLEQCFRSASWLFLLKIVFETHCIIITKLNTNISWKNN